MISASATIARLEKAQNVKTDEKKATKEAKTVIVVNAIIDSVKSAATNPTDLESVTVVRNWWWPFHKVAELRYCTALYGKAAMPGWDQDELVRRLNDMEIFDRPYRFAIISVTPQWGQQCIISYKVSIQV